MLSVTIPGDALKKLEKAVSESGKKLPQEVATVLNAVAKKTRSKMSKDIRKHITASAAGVNKVIRSPRKASKQHLGTSVELEATKRLPLKEFKARQTKKGVSYKIDPTQGPKLIPSAFTVAKFGNHVFVREGKERLPINKKYGVSPWGVFVKRKMREPTVSDTQAELAKQLNARIKYNVLKASGAI